VSFSGILLRAASTHTTLSSLKLLRVSESFKPETPVDHLKKAMDWAPYYTELTTVKKMDEISAVRDFKYHTKTQRNAERCLDYEYIKPFFRVGRYIKKKGTVQQGDEEIVGKEAEFDLKEGGGGDVYVPFETLASAHQDLPPAVMPPAFAPHGF
jgi:hypothetical protein